MNAALHLSHAPTRLAAGAFLLHSGLDKRDADPDAAKHVYGMARDAYPWVEHVDPETFVKLLSTAEIGLGALLLNPIVPKWLCGLGLSAFGGGLLGLYLRLPGMRREDSLRPTSDGLPLSKDVWLASIGIGLLLGGVVERGQRGARRRRRQRRRSRTRRAPARAAAGT